MCGLGDALGQTFIRNSHQSDHILIPSSSPHRQFLIAPPMYRERPLWYRDGLTCILTTFSQMMSCGKPENVHLLPSFPTPSYDEDGIHLTAFSGLEFLLHLFDSSEALLDRFNQQPEEVLIQQVESHRVLEDRVLALELDHRRLNKVVEDKIAIDAELADFRENERNEDCFILEGVPLIPSDITGKPWQDLAIKYTRALIDPLMGQEMRIIVVYNATQRYKDAPVAYCVRMASVNDSKAIRTKFGSFFLGGIDKRPKEFKRYSVRNKVTPATKVRFAILQLFGQRYKDANPGSRVQVIKHEPRPLLKLTPPASADDKRVQTYNFIEAVKKLPANFTKPEREAIMKRVNQRLLGKIRSLFVVLSDDDLPRRKFGHSSTPAGSASGSIADEDSTSASGRTTQKRGATDLPDQPAPAKK